jgi:PAS domain S-box-containing protein
MLEAPGTEVRFEGFLEAAPDAIVGIDSGGRIALVNGQAERLFGYSRAELIGEPVQLLVTGDGCEFRPATWEGYLTGPNPSPVRAGIELAGRRKDRSEFPAEIRLSAVDTPDGRLVAAAIRDVTDRKRAEAKFRGLLEAAPDAIVGVDSQGRISLVNAQTERLFGYSRQELVGQDMEILVPEGARALHRRHRTTYFADPVPRPMGAGMELAARRKDGSQFPAEISLAAIESEDGPLVAAAIRDVSERLALEAERERVKAQAERERFERQLHQSQRLESLGQLAGGVAHDFNNLLAVIANYASFVSEEVAAERDEDGRWEAVRRDVAEIQKAAERATRLTRQLLAFGRREVVQPVVLSVNDVVRDIERLLQRTLGEHIELVTHLAPDLSMVLVDRGQLEQVLLNLAINARDAMLGGGKLSLTTENMVVDAEYASTRPEVPAGPYVRLRVGDSGGGMSREVLERAFEPFFTTKLKGEGSGLGLATVYGIVKQAGGDAEIYSEIGIGTTISILLPVTSDDAPPPPDRPSPARTGGETILVVEDEEAIREVTRRILARNGYHVIVASSADQALALAREHKGTIDLLISDVVMPHMLGKDVAEQVVAIRPTVRVLYMSGYAEPILTSRGTIEPGVTLIEKPFSGPVLLEKVREVLDTAGK